MLADGVASLTPGSPGRSHVLIPGHWQENILPFLCDSETSQQAMHSLSCRYFCLCSVAWLASLIPRAGPPRLAYRIHKRNDQSSLASCHRTPSMYSTPPDLKFWSGWIRGPGSRLAHIQREDLRLKGSLIWPRTTVTLHLRYKDVVLAQPRSLSLTLLSIIIIPFAEDH